MTYRQAVLKVRKLPKLQKGYKYSFKTDGSVIITASKGKNKGDYIPIESAANGRVYQYVTPINNLPQGTHVPYSLIARPQKIQVITYNGGYTSVKRDLINWEVAYSNNDANTFSSLDSEAQKGYAGKLSYGKNWKKNRWNYISNASAEFTEDNFKSVERVRNVEFSRDWNISNASNKNLMLSSLNFSAAKDDNLNFSYKGEYLSLSNVYSGLRNNAHVKIKNNGWWVLSNISLLLTQDTLGSSQFLRQRSRFQRDFKSKIYIGLKSESESNNYSAKSISNNSYRFLDNRVFIGQGDTLKTFVEGGVFNRTDDTIRVETWQRAALANGVFVRSKLFDKKLGNLLFSVQYRTLNTYNDSALSTINSITSRLQYHKGFFRNFLGWNTFYESSIGSEPRKDYKYLKVPKGTGTHVWIDYNSNGVEEIDEFERTNFTDQGDYIRLFVVTRALEPISKIKFSQQLDINFDRLKINPKSLIRKFNWQTYLLLESKELLTENTNSLNPFKRDIADSLLIQSIENFRTTLFFNRSNPVYGLDYTYLQNTAKNLLSYGLENVRLKEHSFNIRYLIQKKIDIRVTYKNNEKINVVPDFSTRNYQIISNSTKSILAYQASAYFRTSADFTYENSINESDGAETLTAQKMGVDLQFNHPKKITLFIRGEYVKNNFMGNPFSPVGYEMLKGLKNGDNLLWQISLQKNLTSFLQIVVNYNGRTSENSPIIHTGTMQVKAFF